MPKSTSTPALLLPHNKPTSSQQADIMMPAIFLVMLCAISAGISHVVDAAKTRRLDHRQEPSLVCGNWATGSRSSAQSLQQQLAACDENQWGKSFTVAGTTNVDEDAPSPCIALACDYVSPKNFRHTQFQLCNVRLCLLLRRWGRQDVLLTKPVPRMALSQLP